MTQMTQTSIALNAPMELASRMHAITDESFDKPSYRTPFMRDRDRVLYCTAFRRLAGKTQIYTIGNDDHKKNRLTHTLEVSQIARTISTALHLNGDLTEAIALGHDLGHTPFGHSGEEMLNEIMLPNSPYIKNSPYFSTNEQFLNDRIMAERETYNLEHAFVGFKHNIQSLRIAASLEDCYTDEDGHAGLNLTNYTLWGILNHSNLAYKDKQPVPDYHKPYISSLQKKDANTEAWSFEAYVVKQADNIAQWHHDLEDALRGGAMTAVQIYKTIRRILYNEMIPADKSLFDSLEKEADKGLGRQFVTQISRVVVNTLVTRVVDESSKNLNKIADCLKNDDERLAFFCNPLSRSVEPDRIISFPATIPTGEFEREISTTIHHSHDVARMNAKGQYVIRKLFEAYYTHPQQLSDGPILHFMSDVRNSPVATLKENGIGATRTDFEKIVKSTNDFSIPRKLLLMRRICDTIAGMTDRFAIDEYNNLYG